MTRIARHQGSSAGMPMEAPSVSKVFGEEPIVKKKVGIWTAILAGGALLAILGATAANTSDTGSGIGMIVFGLLVVSVGLSGLLGVLYDTDTTGLMFAFFGILAPGYSLPFLLYYAGKGMDERAESGRRDQEREREFAAGTRCLECWRPLPGEHSSTCSEYVHRPEVIRRDGSEWVVGGTASVYVPGRSYYTARCSCGWETVDHVSPESAAKAYDQYHGSHVNCEAAQIVLV
jgi:hypothetical protein